MSNTVKFLFNKLAMSVIIIGLCFTTAVLHNTLVKNYETSTLSKYNIFTNTIYMSQRVDESSMKDVEHKIRIKVESQKTVINVLKKIPFIKDTLLVRQARPVIELRMYSGGGSVFAGFGVMNLMKEYQERDNVFFFTVADKFCYSMCFAILQQGNYRMATEYTIIGTHRASGGDQRELRLIERMTGENILKKSTKFRSFKEWEKFYWDDFFHKPSESLYYELIDEVYKGE